MEVWTHNLELTGRRIIFSGRWSLPSPDQHTNLQGDHSEGAVSTDGRPPRVQKSVPPMPLPSHLKRSSSPRLCGGPCALSPRISSHRPVQTSLFAFLHLPCCSSHLPVSHLVVSDCRHFCPSECLSFSPRFVMSPDIQMQLTAFSFEEALPGEALLGFPEMRIFFNTPSDLCSCLITQCTLPAARRPLVT